MCRGCLLAIGRGAPAAHAAFGGATLGVLGAVAEGVGVSELTESTVSHHLAQLRRAGFVESDRRGMNVYHRPGRDAVEAMCAVLNPNCCT